tara:strand:- start:82 stop:1002 length:921 start_codon:yes stop_codon:yes gene_type:complete
MLNILIFGAKGQLGSKLLRELKTKYRVIGLHKDSKKYFGDFINPKKIIETITKIKPDIIINAAAYTKVDKAESNKKIAMTINSTTPCKIASICKKRNIFLIHFSTDYVFSGYGKNPWTENSKLKPINFYGKSKAEADKKISSSGCNYVIFRAAWVYSEDGNNFVNSIIKLSKIKKAIKVVNDQISSPSSTKFISSAVREVIKDFKINSSSSKYMNQIFNIAPNGEVSWHGFALEIVGLLEKFNVKKKLLSENIISLQSKDYNQIAKRPLNSRLNTNKLKKVFDLKILTWQEDLRKVIKRKFEKKKK